MMIVRFMSKLLIILFITTVALAQSDATSRSSNESVKPFRIVENLYYVGAVEITSFLITSPEGHILIDGGFMETAPQILRNIRTLGFKPEDVKILLISQAHYDHAGGLAELKKRTGAKLFASKEDAALLARGGKNDFGFGDKYPYPMVKADQFVSDNQQIRVGKNVLTAHLTPGHTKGCTSYTTVVNGNNVLFDCSTSVPGYNLTSISEYPNIIDDYEHSFRVLKSLACDIPLGAHGSFFHLSEKRKAMESGASANPFIDPKGCKQMINESEEDFRNTIARQRATKN